MVAAMRRTGRCMKLARLAPLALLAACGDPGDEPRSADSSPDPGVTVHRDAAPVDAPRAGRRTDTNAVATADALRRLTSSVDELAAEVRRLREELEARPAAAASSVPREVVVRTVSAEPSPPARREAFTAVERWHHDEALRRTWMFLSESEALRTFGTPTKVKATEGRVAWSYEEDEKWFASLYFVEHRLVDVAVLTKPQ